MYASALKMDKETPETDNKSVGFKNACRLKWVKYDGKAKTVTRIKKELKDEVRDVLLAYKKNPNEKEHDKKNITEMGKRKLIKIAVVKSFKVTKGKNYAPKKEKLATSLTADMLRTGAYEKDKFKKPNIKAEGQMIPGGHLHPLLKVRA